MIKSVSIDELLFRTEHKLCVGFDKRPKTASKTTNTLNAYKDKI